MEINILLSDGIVIVAYIRHSGNLFKLFNVHFTHFYALLAYFRILFWFLKNLTAITLNSSLHVQLFGTIYEETLFNLSFICENVFRWYTFDILSNNEKKLRKNILKATDLSYYFSLRRSNFTLYAQIQSWWRDKRIRNAPLYKHSVSCICTSYTMSNWYMSICNIEEKK